MTAQVLGMAVAGRIRRQSWRAQQSVGTSWFSFDSRRTPAALEVSAIASSRSVVLPLGRAGIAERGAGLARLRLRGARDGQDTPAITAVQVAAPG
jgi:hypothetical protein